AQELGALGGREAPGCRRNGDSRGGGRGSRTPAVPVSTRRVKAGQKVHQWPQGNYISLRSGGNGGLASGRGSARGDSPSLLHGMLNEAGQRTEESYPGSVVG